MRFDFLSRLFTLLTVFLMLGACSSSDVKRDEGISSRNSCSGNLHTVVTGETLFSVAWRYGLDYKKLSNFNAIKSPYRIYPGQIIQLGGACTTIAKSNAGEGSKGNRSEVHILDVNSKKPPIRSNKQTAISSDVSKTPVAGSVIKWQWPTFSKVFAPFEGGAEMKRGIDLVGKLGEPVLSAAAGQVVYAGSGLNSYGNLLIIKHNSVFLSAYAHNNNLLVKEGDIVKAGQQIADMGSSGTNRVKLHFEIRSEGNPVDPLRYLPKR